MGNAPAGKTKRHHPYLMGNHRKVSLLNRIAILAQMHYSLADPLPIEEKLKECLKELTASHLGVPVKKMEIEAGKIYYYQIYCTEKFSMELFILGKGATIPLHDHPQMTVMSKVLHGSAHFTNFDWISSPNSLDKSQAIVVGNLEVDEKSEPRTLYPNTKGNLHEIYAPCPTILFDLMLPPYSDEEGRDCHYFRISKTLSSPKNTSEEDPLPIASSPPSTSSSSSSSSFSLSSSSPPSSFSAPAASSPSIPSSSSTTTTTSSTFPSPSFLPLSSSTSPGFKPLGANENGPHKDEATRSREEEGSCMALDGLHGHEGKGRSTKELERAPLAHLQPRTVVHLIPDEPDFLCEEFAYSGPSVDPSLLAKVARS